MPTAEHTKETKAQQHKKHWKQESAQQTKRKGQLRNQQTQIKQQKKTKITCIQTVNNKTN